MRQWAQIESPDNARRLRAIAKDNRFNYYADFNREFWYAAPAGEIMFCLMRERYSPAERHDVILDREWWVFDLSSGEPNIVEHDGVVTAGRLCLAPI